MLKRAITFLLILTLAFCLASCGKEKKELTCDGCGKTVTVDAKSNMEEDWIIFCEECGDPAIE